MLLENIPKPFFLQISSIRYENYIPYPTQEYGLRSVMPCNDSYLSRKIIFVVRKNQIIDILYNPYNTDENSDSRLATVIFGSPSYPQQYTFNDWIPELFWEELNQYQLILDFFTQQELFIMHISNSYYMDNALYGISVFTGVLIKLCNFLYSSDLLHETSDLKYQLGNVVLSKIQYFCSQVLEQLTYFSDMGGFPTYCRYLSKFYDNLERNFPDDIDEINALRKKLIMAKIVT